MAITLISPPFPQPTAVPAPIVQIRQQWSHQWIYVPDIQLVSAVERSSGDGLGSCVFRRRFGPRVKQQYELDYVAKDSLELGGYWIRVDLVGRFGLEFAWVGRVSSETQDPFKSSQGIRAGVQTWTAYSPLQFLRKISISESIWLEDGEEKRIGWVPPMNRRDSQNVYVGNRSEEKSGGTFLYGGQNLWSRDEYLDYILSRFVDQSADGGPSWTIGGQVELLFSLTDTVHVDGSETVAEIIARLIDPTLGMGYTIQMIRSSPSPGFEILVYALSNTPQAFDEVTLPFNPNVTRIPVDSFPQGTGIRIEETGDQQYDRIEVVGAPIVVCCTLEGPDVTALWELGLQVEYEAGTGDNEDDAGKHDAARQQDRFRAVFQHYGASTVWDHNKGLAAPLFDESGRLIDEEVAAFQNQVRRTLSWIPMLEGVDYAQDPGLDENLGGTLGTPRPPYVLILDPDEEIEGFVPVDTLGIGVYALPHDWGVALNPNPNHLFGKGEFSDEPLAATRTPPKYDFHTMNITFAFESDHRLRLTYETISGPSPIATTKTIFVDDAQFWFLAAETVVGVEESDPAKLKRSGDEGRLIRDDSTRLAFVMAGAIARYNRNRARAVITIKGLHPWPFIIGTILDVIEVGGRRTFIGGPITSIEWTAGTDEAPDPTTIIRAGSAR